MEKAYFISGLGADKRVFSLLDLSCCEPVFIDWIEPLKNESLQSYALRLRQLIPEISPVIVGISFGGMLVMEMAKADKNIKGIIIASSKTHHEIPAVLRIGNYFPLYKWTPSSVSKYIIRHNTWLLCDKDPAHKKLIREIIATSDMKFVRWAIGAILHWKNTIVPSNIIHIHGTADKLLPYKLVKADYSIKDGTHVLTLDKHHELSPILKMLIFQYGRQK